MASGCNTPSWQGHDPDPRLSRETSGLTPGGLTTFGPERLTSAIPTPGAGCRGAVSVVSLHQATVRTRLGLRRGPGVGGPEALQGEGAERGTHEQGPYVGVSVLAQCVIERAAGLWDPPF